MTDTKLPFGYDVGTWLWCVLMVFVRRSYLLSHTCNKSFYSRGHAEVGCKVEEHDDSIIPQVFHHVLVEASWTIDSKVDSNFKSGPTSSDIPDDSWVTISILFFGRLTSLWIHWILFPNIRSVDISSFGHITAMYIFSLVWLHQIYLETK